MATSNSSAPVDRSLAAVFSGISEVMNLAEIVVPELHPGEWLIQILGCTICGSDVHSFTGRRTVPTPTILGHEIVGRIVAGHADNQWLDLGGQVLQVGDRIVWAIVANCNACFFCQWGLPQKCERSVKYGHQSFAPQQELRGGFAEYCVLVAGTSLVRLPDHLSLEVACPVGCATATVVAAFDSASAVADQNVCVIGAGMLGLTACAMARDAGAATVVCIERDASRRELALRFGAELVGVGEQAKMIGDDCTAGRGFDVVFEFSGTNAGFECGWLSVRAGGQMVLVGAVAPSAPFPLALEQIVRRNLSLIGVHNYAPQHLLHAVNFLADCQQRYPFAELVSQWFELEQIGLAMKTAQQRDSIRVGIR